MTTLKVRHLLAIDALDLPLDKITLLCGPNEAGKTTAADAAAACLTGIPLIRDIKAKTNLGPVVATGHDVAQAVIVNEAGARQISWPKGEVKTKGDPPTASAFAVGAQKLTQMEPAARATALISLLQATPTLEDLEKSFTASNLSADAAKKVWDLIGKEDWAGAERTLKERATKLKGQWEHITKERFGAKKAEQWYPTGWDIALADTPPEDLEVVARKAKAKVDEMVGQHAVAQVNYEEAGDLAKQLEHFRNNVGEWASEQQTVESDLEAAVAARAALPEYSADQGVPCPYPQCEGRRLRIVMGQAKRGLKCVDEAEKLTDKEIEDRRMAIASADGKIANLRGKTQQIAQSKAAAEQLVEKAEAAKKAIADAKAPEIAALLEKARAAHETAEQNHAMAKAKREADMVLRQILNMQVAIDALVPTGLRREVLAKALGGFAKKHLKPLCALAALPEIEIAGEDLEVRCGGYGYAFLSRGAKHAVDCVLQVAIARMDGSAMLVIDDADKLIGERRAGLMRMLAEVGLPALVCLAAKPGAKVPDLAKMGLGQTVWLNGAA